MNWPRNIDYRGTRILQMVIRWRSEHFKRSPGSFQKYERARMARLARLQNEGRSTWRS